MPRCYVYIDGYNFYYGLVKDRPDWKWLDIEKFFVSLLSRSCTVDKIKYFTATVDEDHAYSPTRERQEKYFEALGTRPKIKIIPGKYQKKLLRCEFCHEEYWVPREKKTDVNIAVHIMDDCMTGAAEGIVLVSGDSDLEPAVAWVNRKFSKIPITVYIPALPSLVDIRRADFYKGIGVTCIPLPTGRISASQFDRTIKIYDQDGKLQRVIQRPEEWAIPAP